MDPYSLFRAIDLGVRRGDRRFFGEPLRWLCACEERWLGQLTGARAGLDPDESATPLDVVERVAILLAADLRPYEGNRTERCRHYLFTLGRQHLDNHDPADAPMLSALTRLLDASIPFLTPAERRLYSERLAAERRTNYEV